MTAIGASPSSSPRLPSPPPFTEVQIGPKSPSVNDNLIAPPPAQDDASTRRIRPGTKAADMAFGPPLVPLSQLDSPFQLQEHLKASYQNFTRPPGSDTIVPINRTIAEQLAEPPDGVDRSLWLYELCRFLTMKANNIVIAFFAELPPCSAQTCPEMRASEWQYLCAVHDPPKACCAIDYCCHTLDWATNILTSPKFFPSRLTLGSEAAGGPQAGMRHLTNIFRRVYRIFAHAWFQHREVFWQVEGHDGLHVFFKTVCDMYNLLPEDNYTIPAEAEGEGPQTDKAGDGDKKFTILRKEDTLQPDSNAESSSTSLSPGATTRRHRHSPSTGAAVSTIVETAEDDESTKNAKKSPALGSMVEKEERETREIDEKSQEEGVENASQEEASEDVKEAPEESETSLPKDAIPTPTVIEATPAESSELQEDDESDDSRKTPPTSEDGIASEEICAEKQEEPAETPEEPEKEEHVQEKEEEKQEQDQQGVDQEPAKEGEEVKVILAKDSEPTADANVEEPKTTTLAESPETESAKEEATSDTSPKQAAEDTVGMEKEEPPNAEEPDDSKAPSIEKSEESKGEKT